MKATTRSSFARATRLVGLCAVLVYAPAFLANATLTDPAQIQNEAYILLLQGDQSLDSGRLEEALSNYTSARDFYQKVASDFPEFDQRVTQYRRDYCENQIDLVMSSLAAHNALPQYADSHAPEVTTTAADEIPAPEPTPVPEAVIEEEVPSIEVPPIPESVAVPEPEPVVEEIVEESAVLEVPPEPMPPEVTVAEDTPEPETPDEATAVSVAILDENTTLRSELEIAQKERDSLKDALNAQSAARKAEIDSLQERLQKALEAASAAPASAEASDVPVTSPEAAQLAKDLEKTTKKLEKARADKDDLKKQLRTAQKAQKKLEEQLQALQSDLDAKIAGLEAVQTPLPDSSAASIPSIPADESALAQQLADAEQKLAENEQKLAAAEEKLHAASSNPQLDTLTRQLADTETALNEARAATATLEAQLAESQALQGDLQAQIQQLIAENATQMESLARQTNDLAEKNAKIEAQIAQISELQAKNTQQETDLVNWQPLINQRASLIEQQGVLQQEIIRIERERDSLSAQLIQAQVRASQAEAGLQDLLGRIEKETAARVAAAQKAIPPTAQSSASSSVAPATLPPADPLAHARQLLLAGQADAALTILRNLPATTDNLPQILLQATALIRLQRYTEAIALLQPALKKNNRNAELQSSLGAALMGARRYEDARIALDRAIALDKNCNAETYANLAMLYAFMDPVDLAAARRCYQQARAAGLPPSAQLEKILR